MEAIMDPAIDKQPKAQPKASGKPAPKRLILTLKDKGGSGASLLARWIGEAHEARKTGALLVDGDGTTASLAAHFGLKNPGNPVKAFSFHGTTSERDYIARLLDSDAGTVVLDLPATALTVLRRIESEYSWTAMVTEMGWRPIVVTSISPGKKTVLNLADVLDLFGNRADYIAAINLGMGSGGDKAAEKRDFARWLDGKTRPRFLELGGIEIRVPMLLKGIMADIEDHEVTFAAAKISSQEASGLDFVDRAYLAKWYADMERAFEPANKLLGLA